MTNNSLRLALIGKTGVGKSKTGNTILNKNTVKPAVFVSSCRGQSVTEVCQLRDAEVFGRRVHIVDTPGFLDTRKENPEDVLNEIRRCIYMTSPGPHAILHIVEIGRFTAEDVDTLQEFIKHFGENLFKYIIIIFTYYDKLKDESEEDTPDISTFVKSFKNPMKDYIDVKCKGRVVAFDNTLKGSKADDQIKSLFSVIDIVMKENGEACYTNGDYEQAEQILKQNIEKEKIRLENEFIKEMNKRQLEIDKTVDLKVCNQMKKEMEMYRLKMADETSEDKIRKHLQTANIGFDAFKAVVQIVSSIVSTVMIASK